MSKPEKDRPRSGEGTADTLPHFEPGADVSIGGLEDDYPTGTILLDRYRLVKLIGHGSMSAVFLGEHVAIGRQIAIKILKREVSRVPDIVERFRREARVATSIGHPNIVEILDFGETRLSDKFVIMEYLPGHTVAQVLEREQRLDLDRAVPIVMQVCRALHAAHKVGIVHRDLKPANVMLTSGEGYSDFVKVLDFGLAKLTERTRDRPPQNDPGGKPPPRAGTILGTPEYIAPEQTTGTAVDRRADVYALGCVLYEMLCGRPPFVGQDELSVLYMHAHQPPQPPSTLADVPKPVERAILRALAKDPDERYDSMAEFEGALVAAAREGGLRPWTALARPALTAPQPEPSRKAVAASQPASTLPPYTRMLAVSTIVLASIVAGVAIGRFAPRHEVPGPAVLVVETTPSGAQATVDDRDIGTTPAVVRELAPGRHQVQVRSEGYLAGAQPVELRPREVGELRITLARVTHKVPVRSTPDGARVFVDGVEVGQTPTTVELSEHEFHDLRLEKPGFEPWHRYVKADEQPTEIAGELPKPLDKYGSLFVESDAVARVAIDGRDTGFTTPTAELRVAPGKHTITCTDMDTGEVKKTTVTLSTGQVERKFVQMH